MKKHALLSYFAAVFWLFASPPLLALTPHIVVSVATDSSQNGTERLRVRLTNATAKAINVPLVNVPWLTRRSFGLVIAPRDSFPILLQQVAPLTQDAIGDDLAIPAKSFIEGFVDLREFARGVADARRAGPLVVLWLYRPIESISGTFTVQGGFVEFSGSRN